MHKFSQKKKKKKKGGNKNMGNLPSEADGFLEDDGLG